MAAVRVLLGPDIRLRPEGIIKPATGIRLPSSWAAAVAVADRTRVASALSCMRPAAGHREDRRSSRRKSGTHRRSCRRWSSAHALDTRLSWRLRKTWSSTGISYAWRAGWVMRYRLLNEWRPPGTRLDQQVVVIGKPHDELERPRTDGSQFVRDEHTFQPAVDDRHRESGVSDMNTGPPLADEQRNDARQTLAPVPRTKYLAVVGDAFDQIAFDILPLQINTIHACPCPFHALPLASHIRRYLLSLAGHGCQTIHSRLSLSLLVQPSVSWLTPFRLCIAGKELELAQLVVKRLLRHA